MKTKKQLIKKLENLAAEIEEAGLSNEIILEYDYCGSEFDSFKEIDDDLKPGDYVVAINDKFDLRNGWAVGPVKEVSKKRNGNLVAKFLFENDYFLNQKEFYYYKKITPQKGLWFICEFKQQDCTHDDRTCGFCLKKKRRLKKE